MCNRKSDLADGNNVTVEQDGFTSTDSLPVHESSVLAAQISNSQRVRIEQEDAMVTANERAFSLQRTIRLSPNHKFALGDLDRLPR